VLAVVLLGLATPASAAAGGSVALVTVDGVISPVTVRIVTTALERARSEHAVALIIQLDTPGGLERSMRSIVQEILSSDVPVVVYVAPTGARAASAGVFITMAAPIAAMAPATNIGAAHPVAALGGSFDKEMKTKVENDAAAFARTIAATYSTTSSVTPVLSTSYRACSRASTENTGCTSASVAGVTPWRLSPRIRRSVSSSG